MLPNPHHRFHTWKITLVPVAVTAGLLLMSEPNIADASATVLASRYQSQGINQPLPDFDEDDEFEQAGEGFHAIYVDRLGRVLGTFVNVPGAQLQVYAGGEVAISEQDYTAAVDYRSDGRIRSIGDTRLSYFRSGRLRAVIGIDFNYFQSGRFRSIGTVDFAYFSSGRLKEIEGIDFDYDSDGVLETISDRETRNGIRIVVVN
ncbi:MAG: hypothetical protein AAFR26_26960 [Cyanobacteria bacterium J06626_4]